MNDKPLHNLEIIELKHFRDRLFNNERVRFLFILIVIVLSIVIFIINNTIGILTLFLGLIPVNSIGQSLKREIREKYQVQTDDLVPVINDIIKAKNCEKAKNYDEAMGIWEHLGVLSKAAKARDSSDKRISEWMEKLKEAKNKTKMSKAKKHEKLLEFDEAANIYKELEMDDDTIRVRKLKAEQGAVKVTQKVVHGDEVTKTEIKDSVLNRSNVGGGSSKMQELEKLTGMKEKGLISDEEYEKMKQEIIG